MRRLTKIKICGLHREQDLSFVNEAMPDYIGFVFAESRRQVTLSKAGKLKERLCPGILSAGVFVNAKLDEIAAVCSAGILDIIQLHGSENWDYIDRLRQRINLPVIKAISVTPGVVPAEQNADYFLFDQGKGGTGKAFDWSLIPKTDKPYFLAGGLTPQNIRTAIEQVHPYGVDLSSGVETKGVKDREKILQAVRSVKNE